MIPWPPALIEELARRRSIVFIGSGVSRNSVGLNGKRPPIWLEFLTSGCVLVQDGSARKQIKKLLKANDLLTACEILKESLAHHWDDHLIAEFVTPQYQPTEIHRHIFRLDSRLVITQNFDKIYDTYSQASSQGTVVVKNYYDNDISNFIRKRHRVVIKAHGTIDQPAQMVFTKGEYAHARFRHPAFHALLDGLMLTHTSLFLGCGLNDPDVQVWLERNVQLHPTTAPHYIAMSQKLSPSLTAAVKRNLNLEVLLYNAANNHQELSDSLEALAIAVDARRQDLAANLDW